MEKQNYNCLKCCHYWQETTDDVASCNCCEDGEFYEEEDRYTLDDLGPNWY